MTDILTLVFRTFNQHNGKPKDFKNIAPSKCSTLVVGDCSVNRSLLILAAVTAASELGLKVSFFTQVKIQSLPGSLQESMSNLSPDNLKKIKFSYPRSLEDLLQDVASLHESASGSAAPPSLIIVDGLEGYLRGPGPRCTIWLHMLPPSTLRSVLRAYAVRSPLSSTTCAVSPTLPAPVLLSKPPAPALTPQTSRGRLPSTTSLRNSTTVEESCGSRLLS
ncbi:ATPase SWSAP1 isoform X2 [Salmo trutta]|uniref:ATPase SWSAP1 isoform X2 n=1 Tax=Salmo trutta TaxID=8032 RepID=UPI001130F9C8|nr:uncharacterized protein LOC115170565 isoform X2 [Salmo trutta]